MPRRGQERGISRLVAFLFVCLCLLFPPGPFLHWVSSCVWVPCAVRCSPGVKEQKASREQRQIPRPSSRRPSRDEEVGDVPGNVCGERLRQMQVVEAGRFGHSPRQELGRFVRASGPPWHAASIS